MYRFVVLSLWAGVCLAQPPAAPSDAPPPAVDQALRARINEFYQDHVDGKFRQAEALVAEDTKDYYYSLRKPKYQTYEIAVIEYSDGFTRARATVRCEMYVMMPGFEGKPLKVPVSSTWKIVDGQWYWYVEQQVHQTPFGPMRPGATKPADGNAPAIPSSEQMQSLSKQLRTLVKADKTAVTLKPGASDHITITNTATGPMTLSIQGSVPGVDVQIDHLDLKPGGNAVLNLRARDAAKSGTISVLVEQTNQVIPIQINIQ